MSNIALRTTGQVGEHEFTREQLELIKSTVAKGASDNELKLFLYRCKNMGLDPLKPGVVHFVKYGNNPGTIIVGLEGFRSKAARTGKLSGIKRGVINDDKGRLIGGWCEVYRSDWSHPAREEVLLSEYSTGKAMWAKMPSTMIKKVAEVAALRMAFADEIGGVYSEEELHQADVKDVRAKELTAKVQETESAPEFEAADYFTEPEVESEVSLGDFVFSVGKQHKGKKLKEIATKDLEGFVDWAEKQAATAKGIHPSVLECANVVKDYLSQLMAEERD